MTERKWTAGPWAVSDDMIYGKEDGYTVPLFEITAEDDNEFSEEHRSLIAAAPDLYEALENLIPWADDHPSSDVIPIIAAALAAIAKARGEA